MIEWLIQSIAGHPALARGIAPSGLLSEQEQQRLIELKTVKRRSDWLIGRWTAKRLIQAYIERQTGVQPPLHTLTVANDPAGAPRIIADLNLQFAICNLQLSISHCDGRAFCALSDTCGIQLGVDIERIEPRAATFAEDYFTAHELDQLRAAPPESRDTLVTLIWSAKEAALKALRLGLTVDTRSISCTIGAPETAHGWAHMDIVCDRRRLRVSAAPMLSGCWRMMNDYVLTVATTCNRCHDVEIRGATKRAVMLNEVKHLAAKR